MMVAREGEENAERDAMIAAVQAQQQAKEDAERAARDEARRRLMQQVHEIRQRQIAEKQARVTAALEEVAADRAAVLAAAGQLVLCVCLCVRV